VLKDFRKILAAIAIATGLANATYSSQANESVQAFESFVMAGDYSNATFYVSNGFVAASNIDTSQIFYNVATRRFLNEEGRLNIIGADGLYNFLSGISPIDLNRRFACVDTTDTCLIANVLMRGTKPRDVAWFVQRGLDLNKREPDIIPATLPMLVRLGTVYSTSDMNWFVENGLVLGDETYTLEELLAYEDPFLWYNHRRRLAVPDNFLTLAEQNLLDVLAIVLASTYDSRYNPLEQARSRDAICSFMTYAASAYTPSFDYLRHTLAMVPEFRGGTIGKQERYNNSIYRPFPTSCVLLIKAMATAHAQLDQITNFFANEGDVDTAAWLLSIKKEQTN
jgi:hypothetical protein